MMVAVVSLVIEDFDFWDFDFLEEVLATCVLLSCLWVMFKGARGHCSNNGDADVDASASGSGFGLTSGSGSVFLSLTICLTPLAWFFIWVTIFSLILIGCWLSIMIGMD